MTERERKREKERGSPRPRSLPPIESTRRASRAPAPYRCPGRGHLAKSALTSIAATAPTRLCGGGGVGGVAHHGPAQPAQPNRTQRSTNPVQTTSPSEVSPLAFMPTQTQTTPNHSHNLNLQVLQPCQAQDEVVETLRVYTQSPTSNFCRVLFFAARSETVPPPKGHLVAQRTTCSGFCWKSESDWPLRSLLFWGGWN